MLEAAIIHKSLEDFLESNGQGVRFGFSAREGHGRRIHEFEELLSSLHIQSSHPIHNTQSVIQLHFGTEDDGLSLEELEPMNHIVKLATTEAVPSLNLSHAVLLASYILRSSFGDKKPANANAATNTEMVETPESLNDGAVPAALTPGRLEYPRRAIREWLEALGFDLSSCKINIETTLNRVLLSNSPSPEDVRLLEKVLFQTVGKLKNRNKDSGT